MLNLTDDELFALEIGKSILESPVLSLTVLFDDSQRQLFIGKSVNMFYETLEILQKHPKHITKK